MAAEEASRLLRSRLLNPAFVHAPSKSSPDSNYSKLKFIISSSITEGCNNSVLLLGPRGSGKIAVLDLVLEDLKAEHPGLISVIRLDGLLHGDDNCGLREIARQLCLEHQLPFSKLVSSDDNTQFVVDMLRECGLAHKMVIFTLDEFELFTQGKQRVLYSLLDAMQSLTSQAVVIGVSCRLDADQLLEKRVRSRFSHRKLLFTPPSTEGFHRLLEHLLYLPTSSNFPCDFVREFNSRLDNIFGDKRFKEILTTLSSIDCSITNLLRFVFRAVSLMDMHSGLLSLENFQTATLSIQRQPMLENLQICMNRLENKEHDTYNFNSVMKEYKTIHDAYKTSDYHAHDVCLRAFEHLLELELIGFVDKGRGLSIEFRPVKLLICASELYQGLNSHHCCPVILRKLFDRESYK